MKQSLNVVQREAKHSHLSHSLFQYLVVGEEREPSDESRNVHDGYGACHLRWGGQEGQLRHLAIGRATYILPFALLSFLFFTTTLLIILFSTKSHHLWETGIHLVCCYTHTKVKHAHTHVGEIAYVHAEFAAVLSSMFFVPGDQLSPGHLLQSLDLNTKKHWC